MSILNLSNKLDAGVLFRPPDDKLRVDAFIPTIRRQSHAANLIELPNGDLLCAWFAGSKEGAGDICIAMVFNHCRGGDDPDYDPDRVVWPRERYPLTVALSEDDGQNWPFMRHIDTGDNFAGEQNRPLNRRCSYPSIVQTRDGLIHVAYSYRGRQCTKYVRFTEDWIRGQLDWLYPAEE